MYLKNKKSTHTKYVRKIILATGCKVDKRGKEAFKTS